MNKVLDVEEVLLSHDPDILIVTETWLHEGIESTEVVPPSYNIIRKDRQSRGGGVAIIIKKIFSILSCQRPLT